MKFVVLKVQIPKSRKLEVQLLEDLGTGSAESALVVLPQGATKPAGEPYGCLWFCAENAVDLGRDDLSENVE